MHVHSVNTSKSGLPSSMSRRAASKRQTNPYTDPTPSPGKSSSGQVFLPAPSSFTWN
ncbi:hypothetical protein KSP39_PZI020158 [Platanthera zijinensis]|uniref:Uncharacterized protein n=1 Tax=Platanthera zijinensis TaxID=2320716 RepID=A0AAP0AZI0_9ASPA